MSVSLVSEKFVGILRQDSALQDKVAHLFVEARDDVYRYLLTLGLHPPRAQEAVQEVFLRLYATMKKGEEIENPRGWVFRVAHNYGLKVRERQASETPFDPALESRLTAAGDDPEHQTARPRTHAAVSPRGGRSFRTAETLPVAAHGRTAVSGDRVHAGYQRIGGWGVSAARDPASEEGAG